jgi:hypothetical protein
LDVQGDMDKINRALARLDPTGPEAKALQNAPAPTPQAAAPTVDPRDAAALRANSHNPAWAAAIDAKYGQGAAAKVLGQ